MKKVLFAAVFLVSFQTLATEKTIPEVAATPATPTQWQTPCYNIEDDVLKEELTDDASNWKHRYIAYEKDKCEAAYLYYDNSYKVKQDGKKIDLTYVSTAYTPLTAEVAEALNLIHWCGLEGWKKDESQTVSGQECGDFKVPAKGTMLYSIYELKNEDKELSLGEATMDHLGLTPESRHEKLSSRVFQKMEIKK